MSLDDLLKLYDRCLAMAERAPPDTHAKLMEIADRTLAIAGEKAGLFGGPLPTQDVGLLKLQ